MLRPQQHVQRGTGLEQSRGPGVESGVPRRQGPTDLVPAVGAPQPGNQFPQRGDTVSGEAELLDQPRDPDVIGPVPAGRPLGTLRHDQPLGVPVPQRRGPDSERAGQFGDAHGIGRPDIAERLAGDRPGSLPREREVPALPVQAGVHAVEQREQPGRTVLPRLAQNPFRFDRTGTGRQRAIGPHCPEMGLAVHPVPTGRARHRREHAVTFEVADLLNRVARGPGDISGPQTCGVATSDRSFRPFHATTLHQHFNVTLEDMTFDEIIEYLGARDGVLIQQPRPGDGTPEIAWGDAFFYYAPDGAVPANTQPFATLVTKNYPGDERSRLDRPGIFRVNIHAGRELFTTWTGRAPRDPEPAGTDPAVTDTVIAHPVYGELGWLAVVAPGPNTAETVRELLQVAYDRARARSHRRSGNR